REVVAGVVDDRKTVELFVVGSEAADSREALLDRLDLVQRAMRYIHDPEAGRVQQLPGAREVVPDLHLQQLLLVCKGGFIPLRGVVADTEEARGAVAIVDRTAGERPAVLAQPA